MTGNPEFRRNLWLEISTHRLVAMPAVLLLVVFAVRELFGDARRGAVPVAATWMMIAIAWFWGTRRATESVNEELRGHTWDLQRMSALSPWAMTWGKLFGATAFAWYGTFICAAILLIASPAELLPRAFRTCIAVMATGLALHGAAIAASVQVVQKEWTASPRFGLLLVVPVLLLGAVPPGLTSGDAAREIAWYSLSVPLLDFMAASAVLFAAWGVFGAWRMMSRALLVRTVPWATAAFALFLAVYFAGLVPYGARNAPTPIVAIVACGVVVATGLFYALIFTEPAGAMTLRRLLLRAQSSQWQRVVQEMPAWPVAFAVLALFSLAGLVLFEGGAPLLGRDLPGIRLLPLALTAMAVRDAAIFLIFSFAPRPRRVELTALLYLALLDWLVPVLLGGFGLDLLAGLVMPITRTDGAVALAVMAVQAAVAVSLALLRWRRHYG